MNTGIWKVLYCNECLSPIFFKTNSPDLCRECDLLKTQRAIKEDDRALSISELAIWAMSGRRPMKYRKAYRIG